MRREIFSNWPYIFWFAFYFTIFWLILGGTGQAFMWVSIIYISSILFALSPMAESLWRGVSKVRPIRTESERNRLMPLFEDVYRQAIENDPRLSRNITLYIQENMEINAFAFGRGTLALTKGSIELLSDESLKGLIAHEFGHFSHFDTMVSLIAYVGNVFMSLILKFIRGIANILLFIVRGKDSIYTLVFKVLYYIIEGIYRFIMFIGDLILMSVSREHEYMADNFAHKCGFGDELADVLSQIHQFSTSSPESVIEQLRSTHPPLTRRIERLEKANKLI
ncbi:MAG: M48 family metalloprotease [Oscillospiraceae bacterium]|nr:M48 family metalloprotease [Oscillospiraceae bacterium]